MKPSPLTVLFLVLLSLATARAADDWQTLFNGKDLSGWRANVLPKSFTVVDGAIRANTAKESSHLFYVGDLKTGFVRFKNFELELMARGEPDSNSGIFIHTDMTLNNGKNHLAKGYEIQLNNTAKDAKKTGSLYDVVDLKKSPVDETKWFKVHVTVQDKHIVIEVDGQTVVDYTELKGVKRSAARVGRILNPLGGGIALQAHDPSSVYYFKDIRIRQLP